MLLKILKKTLVEDVEQIEGFVPITNKKGEIEYIPVKTEGNFEDEEDILDCAYDLSAKVGFSLERDEEDYVLDEIGKLDVKNLTNYEVKKEISNTIALIIQTHYGNFLENLRKKKIDIIKETQKFISKSFVTDLATAKKLRVEMLNKTTSQKLEDLLISSVIQNNGLKFYNIYEELGQLILENSQEK